MATRTSSRPRKAISFKEMESDGDDFGEEMEEDAYVAKAPASKRKASVGAEMDEESDMDDGGASQDDDSEEEYEEPKKKKAKKSPAKKTATPKKAAAGTPSKTPTKPLAGSGHKSGAPKAALQGSLKALTKNQLIALMHSLVAARPDVKDDVVKLLPGADVAAYLKELQVALGRVNRAFPNSFFGSMRDNFCYRRVKVPLGAFRALALRQAQTLGTSNFLGDFIRWATEALRLFDGLPQWIKPANNADYSALYSRVIALLHAIIEGKKVQGAQLAAAKALLERYFEGREKWEKTAGKKKLSGRKVKEPVLRRRKDDDEDLDAYHGYDGGQNEGSNHDEVEAQSEGSADVIAPAAALTTGAGSALLAVASGLPAVRG